MHDLTGAEGWVGLLVGSGSQAWGRPSCWPSIVTTDLQKVLQCLPSEQVKKISNKGGLLFSKARLLQVLYMDMLHVVCFFPSQKHETVKVGVFFSREKVKREGLVFIGNGLLVEKPLGDFG